jgi:hypothetical protein
MKLDVLVASGAPFLPRSLRQKWGFSLAVALLSVCAMAQNNPVPQIVGPVQPDAVSPGSGAFTLSVYGANFVPGSVVNWNYQPRVTTYTSGHEIQAQILDTDVETNTAGYITVTNPPPGGGSSSASWAQVEVHDPISTITVDAPQYYDFGSWFIEAADFNHDGILDLLGDTTRGLTLELGQGNGTFSLASDVDPDNYVYASQAGYGDFNNDGNIDVASFEYNRKTGSVTRMGIYFGDGEGDFTRGPVLRSNGANFSYVTVGDFNQDGNLDVVTREWVGYLSTYLGNGNGTFTPKPPELYLSNYIGDMLTGDFNDDGKLDLLLLQTAENPGDNLILWFMAGKGDGTFEAPIKTTVATGTSICSSGTLGNQMQGPQLQMSDFNGDGKLDVAFCTDTQIGVALGNGDGTFQTPVFYTIPTGPGFYFAVGDINSDGKQDLIVSEFPDFSSLFVVYLGNGDGTFQSPQTVASGIPDANTGIIVGDFNDSGLPAAIFVNDVGMNVNLQSE